MVYFFIHENKIKVIAKLMRNFNETQIIIMAGGVGSRFWPMSTPDYPKQL